MVLLFQYLMTVVPTTIYKKAPPTLLIILLVILLFDDHLPKMITNVAGTDLWLQDLSMSDSFLIVILRPYVPQQIFQH